ncbi:MAG: transposase [Planctomycetota bacterium]
MTSKSPKDVARAAYQAGKDALPKYANKYSRRDFTCAQLFAILVLRKFFKQDYRGAIAFLEEWSDLREILDLQDKLPHYTTPQKASEKLLSDPLFRKLLKQTLEQFYRYPKHAQIDDDDVAWVARIDLAAGDSTGFESGHCSKYFTKRKKRGKNKGDPDEPVAYRTFPKLGVVADCESHMILSRVVGVGPRPDNDQVLPLMENMTGDVLPDTTLWDAGYDSENNHELLREYLEIESIIPPSAGRPTNNLPKSKWRWLMATDFDPDEVYGQRWQVETVMRMIKARQGEALTARSNQTRNTELSLMVLTHNLMVVLRRYWRGFLQSKLQ